MFKNVANTPGGIVKLFVMYAGEKYRMECMVLDILLLKKPKPGTHTALKITDMPSRVCKIQQLLIEVCLYHYLYNSL